METAMEAIIKEVTESPVLREQLVAEGEFFLCPDSTSPRAISNIFWAVGHYTTHLPTELCCSIRKQLCSALNADAEDFVAEAAELLDNICPQGYYFGSKSVNGQDWLGFFQQ